MARQSCSAIGHVLGVRWAGFAAIVCGTSGYFYAIMAFRRCGGAASKIYFICFLGEKYSFP
jgi:hypothetical protein